MKKRYKKTLKLVKRLVPETNVIYDIGRINEMSEIMQREGYYVSNNIGFTDLDYVQSEVKAISTKTEGLNSPDITTAFQILEHLTNPFTVLQAIQTKELLITVPLKVWFSNAYWGKDDYDRHFHEFEARQILWLLEKTGWNVLDSGKWYFGQGFGIRPVLRLFWPSYIWIHCKRKVTV